MRFPWIPVFIAVIATAGSEVVNNTGDGQICGKITCLKSQYCDDEVIDDITTMAPNPVTTELVNSTKTVRTTTESVTMTTDNSATIEDSSNSTATVTSSDTITEQRLSFEPTTAATNLSDSAYSNKCRSCENLCSTFNTSDFQSQNKYSVCESYCKDTAGPHFLGIETRDQLGVAAAVVCGCIISLFAGRLIYKKVRKKMRTREQERDDEDTLFIMQDPEWLHAVPPAADTALCPGPRTSASSTLGDTGGKNPTVNPSVAIRRPGLSGGEYGAVTLHAAGENLTKV